MYIVNSKTPIIPGEVLIFKEDLPPYTPQGQKLSIGLSEEIALASPLGIVAGHTIEDIKNLPGGINILVGFYTILAVEHLVASQLNRCSYIRLNSRKEKAGSIPC